ncbi:amidase family protein [Janthinobacterium sp. SUN118]|uniref:amidase family protein n=1 Tax=Janthinobacterium sp. SUN118 TaxID=3004100 RepID=UPI0025B045A3|nr:amidase family protein [Janthinobacterium sp. SUN118]MDN2712414.1 amidase family protein [Janthinobacterium sp. SUN118]
MTAVPARASRPVLARATAPASPMAHLLDAGVLPQQQMMQAGKLSSHALTSQYLARIRSLCSIGARAYPGIEINPDALKIALEMDRERQGHKVRGPLHGIPVVLRDNIATGDRMTTRTQAPAATHARCDSFVAARLRAAGAVIIGKSNLRQWAAVSVPHASASWAGLTILAVDSEADGSIVAPASTCGLVAIQPTGRAAAGQAGEPAAAGPMAPSVREAAWLLAALCGDTASNGAALDVAGLHGRRIGVARGLFGRCAATDAVIEQALQVLRGQGAELVELPPASVPGAIEELLRAQALDALVGPTCHAVPPAHAIQPQITVPAGAVHGLPVGLSFIGALHAEAQLIAMAYAYEQATLHRRTPALPSSITLALRLP